MLDEKDENRKFTKIMLSDKLKYVGAAKSTFKGKTIVTFIVADNVQVLKDKEFVHGLFEEINILRRTPKSYIKFIETLREETPKQDVTKIAHASKLITYLKSTRFYGPLQHSDLLTKAALSRIAVMKELKQVKKHSSEDIKVFLSDHCSGYFNVAEIVSQGYDVPNTLLSNVLVNEEFDTGARSYVFNPRLYWVGIAHDAESKITVVLFADNVEEKKDDGIYVHTHWRKINRPELSEDEILQIRKDFTKLDVTNRGTIFPQHILVMMNKNTEFQKRNPVYYNAFKNNADNILYEQSGINVDQFIEECKKIIAEFDNERWKSIFLNYVNDANKKVIDYEIFRNITQSLGYHISDEECLEIMKKLSDENAAMDLNKFIQIMNIVENKN
jgi:Ca2+-binding EF-hand superfamily protein